MERFHRKDENEMNENAPLAILVPKPEIHKIEGRKGTFDRSTSVLLEMSVLNEMVERRDHSRESGCQTPQL